MFEKLFAAEGVDPYRPTYPQGDDRIKPDKDFKRKSKQQSDPADEEFRKLLDRLGVKRPKKNKGK